MNIVTTLRSATLAKHGVLLLLVLLHVRRLFEPDLEHQLVSRIVETFEHTHI
jgi:hypothetical protein